jgi:hypothetical protein
MPLFVIIMFILVAAASKPRYGIMSRSEKGRGKKKGADLLVCWWWWWTMGRRETYKNIL